MLIQNIEFRPGGLAVIFDDGTEAVGTFKVVNNIMIMDGFSSVEEQLLSAFISRMDATALLDPRLDICKLAAPTDGTSEPTSQEPTVANDLLQWSRADSITGVVDGGTAVFWPAMVGEDGFATQVDISDDFTGGGKWVDNAVNGFPAVESPANSTQGTAWWDDWNVLQIGDRPLIFFFVVRLKFEQLSATSQLISDTNIANAVEGINIGYQGGAAGWRHGSWGKGSVTDGTDVLTVSNYAPTDTDWHVYTVQFLPATTRDHIFYDGATLQTKQSSATGVGTFPDSTEGMSIFKNRQTPTSQWHGLLAEFRIYEGFMTDVDRNAVIHALEERYDL